MTACASKLQHLSVVAESAWGEDTTDMTGAQQLPHTGVVDVSTIRQAILESQRATQYKNEVKKGILGPWEEAEITYELELVGHGSTTAGAITITEFENHLAWFLGAAVRTATSGHTFDEGSDEDEFVLDATPPTFAVGGLARGGDKGDGGGDGQWFVVAAQDTTALDSKVALPAAPANDDPVYSAVNVYTLESTCGVDSKRMAIKTSDGQWVLHGCYPKRIQITGTAAGEIQKVVCTVGVSWAEPVTTTFPDTTTTASWTYNPAPAGAGSIFLQDYGTATRQILKCRRLTFDFQLGIRPQFGFDAANAYAKCVGAKRVQDMLTVTALIDAEGASATPTWETKARAGTPQHLLAGFSVGVGSAVAFYAPYLIWAQQVAVQVAENDTNHIQLTLKAGADTTGATELARSMFRMGFS